MSETRVSDTRVLLVDDHAMVRQALSERLGREPGFTVVATAANADEGIEAAKQHTPDIVTFDIDMPGRICFDAAAAIRQTLPAVKIIFVSAFFHDSYIEDALKARAHGYVTKGESLETIVTALREVAHDGVYFSDEVRERLVMDAGGVRLAPDAQTRVSVLTDREREVLRYLARGLSKKEIASMLSLSVKTIENHTANLMVKLKIHDRVELARFAIREGLAEA